MRKISGCILVQGSNVGVPNLVVSAHDARDVADSAANERTLDGLVHRAEDIKSVQAQNRHAELENLRFASRLVATPQLLQDPRIDKRIVVDQGVGVVMDSNP